jgi:long-subunit fatty acid transport protein
MRNFVSMVAFASSTAMAGSIQAPGVIAGPDSGAATPNPASTYYNPAALAAADGFEAIFDVQLASVRVDVDSWRNGGFDPNTGDPYTTATARVKVPVTFIGASYELIEDRLTAGLGLTMPFVGGGDYTSSESAGAPPYTSHQRYFGVNTKVITAQVIPAIGFTPVQDWGLHLGAGMTYTMDVFSIVKASNVGQEGVGGSESEPEPYSTDAVLSGDAKGSHIGWTAGVFFDKIREAQIGVSYTSAGRFNATGEGEVLFPGFLVEGGEPKTIDADLEIGLNLPAIWRIAFNSQITDKFNLGASVDQYRWFDCCGGPDGDIEVSLQDKDGNEVGSGDDTVLLSVSKKLYGPRRLWDTNNVAAFGGYQATEEIWVGGRVAYNQNAVPDYAVGATNLDFENAGFQLGLKYRMPMGQKDGGITYGLSYSKFYLVERKVAGTAWDGGGPDERFSPSAPPFNVSGDGHYRGAVDIFGVRLGWDS